MENIKNLIAVASGKGGVGKSTIAANLAISLAKEGFATGLVDADIYGPSIPTLFGSEQEQPEMDGEKMIPLKKFGVKMLSIGLFVNEEQPLVWRGPMAANAMMQLFNDAIWGELDYLIIDMPPGTGDIALSLVQNLPITGALIVTTPQQLAVTDVRRAVNMFRQKEIKVPILGLVENMAWFTPEELPDNKYYIFGKNGGEKFAKENDIPLLGQIPMVQAVGDSNDHGVPVASLQNHPVALAFDALAKSLVKAVDIRNTVLPPTQTVCMDPNAKGCGH